MCCAADDRDMAQTARARLFASFSPAIVHHPTVQIPMPATAPVNVRQPDPTKGVPTVSIGMPVHNGGALFERAFASIMAQTWPAVEILVSDNNSSDGCADVARAQAAVDGRIRFFSHDATLSSLDNFRFVLSQARGEFFFWAAHDDQWHPGFAEAAATALAACPDASAAFGVSEMRTPSGDIVETYRPPYHLGGQSAYERVRNYLDLNSPDMLVYAVFRREHLLGFPWVSSTCTEKAIIMHALCRGPIIDAEAMFHLYSFVPKTPEQIASMQLLSGYNAVNHARAYFAISLAMWRQLGMLDFLRLFPRMTLRQNWHKEILLSSLQQVGLFRGRRRGR
jgi:glycosyltransferase involved in cell wall biosynthesis